MSYKNIKLSVIKHLENKGLIITNEIYDNIINLSSYSLEDLKDMKETLISLFNLELNNDINRPFFNENKIEFVIINIFIKELSN